MHVSAQASTKMTLTTALSTACTTSRLVCRSSSSTFRSHASTTACRLTSRARGLRPTGAWHGPCHCTSAWHGGLCRCTPSTRSWSPGPLERNAGDHARGPGATNAAGDPSNSAAAAAAIAWGGTTTERNVSS